MKAMLIKCTFLCLLFLVPSLTFAGEIFGTLKKDGKPLVKQEVTIIQHDKVIGKAITDEKGYFSIIIKQIGKCTIKLTGYEGAVFDVFSTNNSTGYTLSLVKAGDQWALKKL